jgi:hypothetical protein
MGWLMRISSPAIVLRRYESSRFFGARSKEKTTAPREQPPSIPLKYASLRMAAFFMGNRSKIDQRARLARTAEASSVSSVCVSGQSMQPSVMLWP